MIRDNSSKDIIKEDIKNLLQDYLNQNNIENNYTIDANFFKVYKRKTHFKNSLMKILIKIILIIQIIFPYVSSDVSGNNGVVVSSKIHASDIGISIMKNGGNAIDLLLSMFCISCNTSKCR